MKVLKAHDRERHPELFDQMFRGRAEVFLRRLRWPVTVRDGLETDYYDEECDPAYLVDLDEQGVVRGSLRLLPTTSMTMIRREFLDFFEERVDFVDPNMWECTKFCVHAADSTTSVRLLIGLHKLCTNCGIERIVGLYELPMERVYARIGWKPRRIAAAKPGLVKLGVGVWTADLSSLQRMEAKLAMRGGLPGL
ncbi:N-acyl-L-homoserine lactone synthetase [Ochrobactrum intermedium]|jgi:N-acyl-L-homoserine lactone synthetase|uniref:Acyl-homoserine-lactone synthase n=1 Tax=Brucella intermedia TaxID=94625 RepID=A0ABR6AVN8_9HYPH|nr:acyl-homoserine-lactone synthase [Brucella intermedia]ERI14238.1 hypothetical protein O206_22825 [Ochrobactrum sp. EGD-AQ16]KAB2705212.1 GNAT family N-acetyltransferase [Brucella intermedia]MBA8853538.1 N-acyl-L-homoserine lactone synthetase [Brucella intermedia]MPR64756.1 GNAT family N-acetyltransferase [Brucella intermedia]